MYSFVFAREIKTDFSILGCNFRKTVISLLCVFVLSACSTSPPRTAESMMTALPKVKAGPVVRANLVATKIDDSKWLYSRSVLFPTLIPTLVEQRKVLRNHSYLSSEDIDAIKAGIFDPDSKLGLWLTIEKLHLNTEKTVGELFSGDVHAEANGTYVLRLADGAEVFREDIQTTGVSTFSESTSYHTRKLHSQRHATIANFDAFRLALVARSKEINAKLK